MWPFSSEKIEGTATPDSYTILYGRVHDGPGVSGLSQTVGTYRDGIKADFANAEQALHDALNRAGAVWVGDAADAMQAGVRPMAGFSADAATAADQMAGTVQTEADGFADTKHRMPEPVSVTATDNALERTAAHLFGNQTDKEQQEAAKDAAEAEGTRIYREYDATSSSNVGSAAGYPSAPPIALGAADPGAQDARVDDRGGPSVTQGQSAPGAAGAPAGAPAGGGGAIGSAAAPGGVVPPAPAPGPAAVPAPASTPGSDGAGRTGGSVPGGAPRGGGAGAGFVPAPIPTGGGTAGGAGNRWRRTAGPGLFDNDPKGTRGGGRGAGAASKGGAAQAGGARPDAAERSSAGRAGGSAPEGGRTAAAAGARGGAGGMGGAMAGPGGTRKGEDDTEHKTPDYLVETVDIYGDDRKVVPPVIGEDPPEADR